MCIILDKIQYLQLHVDDNNWVRGFNPTSFIFKVTLSTFVDLKVPTLSFFSADPGTQKLIGENLKLVWAKFSTIS